MLTDEQLAAIKERAGDALSLALARQESDEFGEYSETGIVAVADGWIDVYWRDTQSLLAEVARLRAERDAYRAGCQWVVDSGLWRLARDIPPKPAFEWNGSSQSPHVRTPEELAAEPSGVQPGPLVGGDPTMGGV